MLKLMALLWNCWHFPKADEKMAKNYIAVSIYFSPTSNEESIADSNMFSKLSSAPFLKSAKNSRFSLSALSLRYVDSNSYDACCFWKLLQMKVCSSGFSLEFFWPL